MGQITINTIPSNEELFALAKASGTTGAEIFANYDNFAQFASNVSNLDSQTAREKVNEFLNITMAWFDKEMYVEEAVDLLEEQGFGTKESMNYAGMMRNLYIKVSDPVDPKFKGLKNGDDFSPYITRKPEVIEYFFTTNSDYQNYITIQPVEIKTAFASEFGVSELEAKTMEGLRNKFVEWTYNKKLEVLNLLINDSQLKDSQKIEVTMNDYSNAELQNLSNVIDNVVSAMTLNSTGAFNMNGWKARQKKANLKILMKPLIDNASKNYVTPYAFNDVILKNGVDKVYVENFGGLIPVVEVGGVETELSVIYDNEGRTTHTYQDANENVYTESQISWKDPNEDVLAVIADKDIMKVIEQEGYITEAIYNPRTRQTNFWASEANVGFIYDRQKNIVIIKKKLTEPTPPTPPTPPAEPTITIIDPSSKILNTTVQAIMDTPVNIGVKVENSTVEPLTTSNFKITVNGNNIAISELEPTSEENEYNLSTDFSTLTSGTYNAEVAYVEGGETKATDMLSVNITQ